MKKLLTLVLTAVMLMTMSFAGIAAPATLQQLLAENSIPTTRSLDVPVDIQVDIDQDGTYVDGPLTKVITENSEILDYKSTIYMSDVRSTYTAYMTAATLLVAGIPSLESQLANCRITGGFTIKIVYPETADIPAAMATGTSLYGFNAAALNAFEETAPRTITNGAAGTKELTISIAVKSPYILASEMTANLETYLPDITLTCEDATLNSMGENKVIGTITGSTLIYDEYSTLVATINYTGKQGTASGITGTEISETVTLYQRSGINAGNPAGGGKDEEDITITVELPNSDETEPVVVSPEKGGTAKVDIDELTERINPEREGFAFDGFYDSPTYNNKLEGEISLDKDTTIYGRWINITAPSIFNSEEHKKYINGYPDGTVRPENNITREEVATIFYRLLKDEVRVEIETSENDFTDVEADRWSNTAVSTMANGGYINGYPDGTFRPEAFITRAELAAMTSRFLDAQVTGEKVFNDIDGHWAEDSILSIANNEWLLGYEDGSFRPDDYITRAEAITIINRIIVRYVNEHGLTGNEKIWPDNPVDEWYYFAVIEASHNHDHERAEDKYNELWSNATVE